MAFISIDYNDGGNPLNYKGVKFSFGKNKKRSFNSGNFEKDWFDLKKFIIFENISMVELISCSSSVDHFIMDGAPYDSAYLHHLKDDEFELKYINDCKTSLEREEISKGWEFFVEEGTKPTWKELKEKYKQ